MQELVQFFRHQQRALKELASTPPPSSPPVVPPPTSTPDYFTSAKYEDLTCRPIKPLYGRTSDNLVPFLNRLDIRCHDEGWGSITTYIKIQNSTLDLIKNFAKIPELAISHEAKFC
jgi:hypothetical protein